MKFLKLCLAGIILILFSSLENNAQLKTVKYGYGKWNADSLGNHRAVINYDGSTKAAHVVIPWRRKDVSPEKKGILIIDAKTNNVVKNIKTVNVNREFGELFFEPVSGKGKYYVYYLLYKNEGRSNYPRGIYRGPIETASSDWLKLLETGKNTDADCIELQSVDEFNSFYPMEVIATKDETDNIIKAGKGNSFLIFPEDREFPIKMDFDLPLRWIEKGNSDSFTGQASRGEYFTFQLGVFALKNLSDVKIKFTDLKAEGGKSIPAKQMTCFNAEGIGYDAIAFKKTITVDAGKIQALWNGINVPVNTPAGKYIGNAMVSNGSEEKVIQIILNVKEQILADGGINEPWKQTRLNWINSTLAQKNDIIPPYIPLKLKNNSISLLGRKVVIAKSGLPNQIQSFIAEEMTSYTKTPKNIIARPFEFIAEKETGIIKWNNKNFRFTFIQPGTIKWEALNTAEDLKMLLNGSLEFDGFASFEIKITAQNDIDLKDIRLEIPYNKESANYMMGLGQKGGTRPADFNWKWDVANKNQDGAWIGDVNAGMQYSLRGENYSRPLNTNFYLQKPLNLPVSWGNNGNGGISISEKDGVVVVKNFSGPRKIKKGETLYFNFTLLITPFHTIDTDFQWSNRFYHSYKPIDTIKATGATLINIHHANAINPFINYPFIAHKEMKAYINEAHSKGLHVKIYNTVRELSNRAYELFPLKSLGKEIFSVGNGGGFSWLQEHFSNNYIAAWFVPELKDAAIINSGMSRWHNYYVEGMNWLVKNVGIDGIYLDDVAFDRITMKRIKRVLTMGNHPGIIDLHSANQYNTRDGFINSAMLYMEHFPYLNRLWFGEYFDYEKNNHDFFLTEVSGIPFGLMGEMLQDGGNPWRGMVFGMTNRMPWTTNSDPRPLWKVWDQFGIKGSKMIGYWVNDNPVKTNNEDVIATVYKKKGSVLISIAGWAQNDTNIKLKIDWKALGLNPEKAVLTAPAITNFQPEKEFKTNDEIPVAKNKGWLLILKEK